MKARLARFYSWSPTDIDHMPYKDACDYYLAIDALEAQDTLIGLTISDYPNLKKEGKTKTVKGLEKIAYAWKESEDELLSFKEFAKRAGTLNGR